MQSNTMLQEICAASSMKATSALSRFLKIPLKLNIKPVEINSIKKINLPHYTDKMSVSLFSQIKTQLVKGGSSFLFTQKSAFALCDYLLNKSEGSTNKLTEIEDSALKELANIVLGNFLTSFSQSLLTGTMLHTPATIENENFLEVIKHIRTQLTESIGDNSAINIAFSYEHDSVKGDINIVLESGKILSQLRELMVLSNG
ncbi:MAG: chemotaxis protein CheC [Gammaproteobacteria bacterium]